MYYQNQSKGEGTWLCAINYEKNEDTMPNEEAM